MLLDTLSWRYATKKMDPSKTVSEDKVDRIVEAARLAPTSSGLQPFEVIVVTNKDVREKIKAIAWNQAQVTDGSHLSSSPHGTITRPTASTRCSTSSTRSAASPMKAGKTIARCCSTAIRSATNR